MIGLDNPNIINKQVSETSTAIPAQKSWDTKRFPGDPSNHVGLIE
jgi:hypothetical protein